MAKQTILSKDFFVDAPDQPLKETIRAIPQQIQNIKFVGENSCSESVKFLYESVYDTHEVTVSILPLTCEQTRVALYVTHEEKNHAQGQNVLDNFESAIYAMLNGRPQDFQPRELKRSSSIRFFNFSLF